MNQGCLPLQKYGDYYLVDRLATSDNAELWLACRYIDKEFRNFCVIKRVVFKDSYDDSPAKKLLREGQTTFQLRHPNIVTCTDYGKLTTEDGESVFMAMDYVPGKNLAQVQRCQNKPLDQREDQE